MNNNDDDDKPKLEFFEMDKPGTVITVEVPENAEVVAQDGKSSKHVGGKFTSICNEIDGIPCLVYVVTPPHDPKDIRIVPISYWANFVQQAVHCGWGVKGYPPGHYPPKQQRKDNSDEE